MKDQIIKNIEKWIDRNQEDWGIKDSLFGKFRFKASTKYENLNKPLNEVDYKNLSDEEFVVFIENFYRSIFK